MYVFYSSRPHSHVHILMSAEGFQAQRDPSSDTWLMPWTIATPLGMMFMEAWETCSKVWLA
jgi:hypothetical protein